jgi:hypothetical protein
VLPDHLTQLIRDLLAALDALNHYKPSDRRLTWVDISFHQVGGHWKAFAKPRVELRKWNALQSLHLFQALEGFNQKVEGKTWAHIVPHWTMDEIMDLAHKELDAIR